MSDEILERMDITLNEIVDVGNKIRDDLTGISELLGWILDAIKSKWKLNIFSDKDCKCFKEASWWNSVQMKVNGMNEDERKKYIGFGCFAQCDQVKIECVDCTVHRECLEEWKRINIKGEWKWYGVK